ncbi:hypothetical protein FRX31_016086 [Thalictrum thalictroides]|uniref:F-box associated beta-propeller type 3 domain-containing protein n=1 Tax=Thalictrum thalictroides TaxID=46969 RepID=A0A7J6WCK6_THATH|nr:hypothetical protein FRX31_016086 [Thalictrum thalictroides]
MKDEIFKVIPSPNSVRFVEDGKFNHDIKIGELGGLLCVFIMPEGENVQVWVMEEYSEVNSWTKKFIIGQPDFCPLGVTHDEEIILLNRKNAGKLILYNPKTSSVRSKEFGFEFSKKKKFGFEFHNAFIFIRSVLSPTLYPRSQGHHDIEP